MQGIFLYYKEINKQQLTGIDKKVIWQLEEINNNGIKCDMLTIKNKVNNIIDKLLLRLPFTNIAPKWEYFHEFDKVDFIYLRRPTAITGKMTKIFKKIKECNPKVKIIVEIPTYPYDYELKVDLTTLPLYIKDRINRTKFYKYVDRIAVQNKIKTIFEVKTLNFINGIKFSDVSIREPEESNKINMCIVASMEPWQGYERVIKSLYNYYDTGGNRDIIIHFVGTGSELEYYKNLVRKFNLSDNIKFYGFMSGDDLNRIYNKCDLAFDAFGRYKTSNLLSTSLKSREYLAKGLPVISGSNSDLFNKSDKYYLQFPDDATLFDFNEILEFYDEVYDVKKSKADIAKEIREMAFNKCDISVGMKDIIQYIKSQSDNK